MPLDFAVPFGALPKGTVFERSVYTRNTTGDRRRYSLQRWSYTKISDNGTQAGWAQGGRGEFRMDLHWLVFIDGTNLQLVAACLRSDYYQQVTLCR